MAGRVHRVTMFQLPGKDDQAKLLESYKKLRASQEKVCFACCVECISF